MRNILLSRQTHYLILFWALTWFSYWLFLKNEVVAVNITGMAASAGLIALIRFSSARNMATKALKLATPQISKSVHASQIPLNSHAALKVETHTPNPIPSFFAGRSLVATKSSDCRSVQGQKSSVQPAAVKAVVEPLKQVIIEPAKPVEKTAHQTIQSSGCPKNLEYYKKKPRPKQTPTECFSCKNLISCVCQTSD